MWNIIGSIVAYIIQGIAFRFEGSEFIFMLTGKLLAGECTTRVSDRARVSARIHSHTASLSLTLLRFPAPPSANLGLAGGTFPIMMTYIQDISMSDLTLQESRITIALATYAVGAPVVLQPLGGAIAVHLRPER